MSYEPARNVRRVVVRGPTAFQPALRGQPETAQSTSATSAVSASFPQVPQNGIPVSGPRVQSDVGKFGVSAVGPTTSPQGTSVGERRPSKQYTNESGYAIDIQKMNELFKICGNGICLIHTSTGASGTGALYELLSGVYTLMTNHHVIRTTEVAEICRTKYKFEALGEVRMRPDDVEMVVTSPEEELDVTIVQLREAFVESLKKRGAHFFPVRAPKQYDQVALVQYPNGKFSFDKGVIEEIVGVDVKYYIGGDCGASGSPLLSWNFEAIGVHKRRENEAANVALGCLRIGTAMPFVIDFFMKLLLAHFRNLKTAMADVKKQMTSGAIKELERERELRHRLTFLI